MNDQLIEQEIQDKGKTAARVTPQDIQDNIIAQYFFTAENGVLGEAVSNCKPGVQICDVIWRDGTDCEKSLPLLTFCVIVLKNGFTVTGESSCASPENFDESIGRKIAQENAMKKIWPLMGYELRTKLASKE